MHPTAFAHLSAFEFYPLLSCSLAVFRIFCFAIPTIALQSTRFADSAKGISNNKGDRILPPPALHDENCKLIWN